MRSKSKISGGGSELAEGVEGLNPGKPGPAKAGVHRLRKKSNFGVFCCCRLWPGLKPDTYFIGFSGPAEAVPLLQSRISLGFVTDCEALG